MIGKYLQSVIFRTFQVVQKLKEQNQGRPEVQGFENATMLYKEMMKYPGKYFMKFYDGLRIKG